MSYAVDDVMEHLGLDAAYRESTRCTLYTSSCTCTTCTRSRAPTSSASSTSILDSDRKRIHAGCDFRCPRIDGSGGDGRDHAAARASGREAERRSLSPPDIAQRLEACRLSPRVRRQARRRLPQDRAQAPMRPHAVGGHSTFDRAAQHRARSARAPGPTRWRPAMPPSAIAATVWRVHPDARIDAATTRTIARSPSCRAFPMRPSSPCRITRRRPWPARSPRAAPADSSASARGLLRDSAPMPGGSSTRELRDRCRRPALLRPELLRLREFLRQRGDAAGPDRRASRSSAAWR